jgi:hypothetical protein
MITWARPPIWKGKSILYVYILAALLGIITAINIPAQQTFLLAGYTADSLTTPLAIRLNGLLLILGAALIMVGRPALRRWEANAAQPKPVAVDTV